MAGKRFYDDGCLAAHALDLTAERWALLVVRELMLGPLRFTDLRRALRDVSPNVLSQRLSELERAGVLTRYELPLPAPAQLYALTERGRALEDVLVALARWGAGSPLHERGQPMDASALVLALRALFDPEQARWLSMTVELVVAGRAVDFHVARRRLEVLLETDDRPDATIEGDADALASVTLRGRALADAVAAGELAVRGDRRSAEAFCALFPEPAPAGQGPAA